jgi:hypothetical protein
MLPIHPHFRDAILKRGPTFFVLASEKTIGEGRHSTLGDEMAMGGDYLAGTNEERPGRVINWMPLVIVIAAVSLASLSVTLQVLSYYGGGAGDIELRFKIMLILGFLSFTASAVTVALVVYSQESLARIFLVVGIVLTILLFAMRTELYFRAFSN